MFDRTFCHAFTAFTAVAAVVIFNRTFRGFNAPLPRIFASGAHIYPHHFFSKKSTFHTNVMKVEQKTLFSNFVPRSLKLVEPFVII
jgi:hypothetical protein